MIEVTTETFPIEVLEKSKTTPVLVDLWAPWCGPCKTLGPRLESLETEYQGGFVLAKINTDEHPELGAQLSQILGVRSIPVCAMFKDGQIADAFVGAVPDAEIRTFLSRWANKPEGGESEASEEVELDDNQLAAKWAVDLEKSADDHDARFNLARFHLRNHNDSAAADLLLTVLSKGDSDRRYQSLKLWMDCRSQAAVRESVEQLQTRVNVDKRDFDAHFQLAEHAIASDDWDAAMAALLDIVMRDRSWQDDRARIAYVAILDILSDRGKVADDARRQLSMALF